MRSGSAILECGEFSPLWILAFLNSAVRHEMFIVPEALMISLEPIYGRHNIRSYKAPRD